MTSKYDDDTIAFVGLPEIAVTIEDDIIISDVFDDIYFNRTQGLQESEYVFCEGTNLLIYCAREIISPSLKQALVQV